MPTCRARYAPSVPHGQTPLSTRQLSLLLCFGVCLAHCVTLPIRGHPWATVIGLDTARVDSDFLHSFSRALLRELRNSSSSECLLGRQLFQCSEDVLPGIGHALKWAEVELAQHLIDSVESGQMDVQIISSWATVLSTGEWSPPRSDAGAGDLSGALFVQCPPTGCATTFDDPRALKFVGSTEYLRALGNNAKADISAVGGMAMVFPSYLERYTPPVKSTGDGEASNEQLQVHFTATVTARASKPQTPPVVSFANRTMMTTEAGTSTHVGSVAVPTSLSMQRTELWATTVTTGDVVKGCGELIKYRPAPTGACTRPGRGRYADGSGVHPLAELPEAMKSMVDRALEMHVRNTVRLGKDSFNLITAEVTEVWVSTASADVEEKRAACGHFAHADIRGIIALGAALTIGLEDPRQTARLTKMFGSADSTLLVDQGSAVIFPAWLRSAYVPASEAMDPYVIHFNAVVRMVGEGEYSDADQSISDEIRVKPTIAPEEQDPATLLSTIDSSSTDLTRLTGHTSQIVESAWGVDLMRMPAPHSQMERAWMKPFVELLTSKMFDEESQLPSSAQCSGQHDVDQRRWPTDYSLFAQSDDALTGVGMARNWAEAALETYLVEHGKTDGRTLAKILSSWVTQVCPDRMQPHLSQSNAGADIIGLLMVRGCVNTDCKLVLDDPRVRAVASSKELANEIGYGSSTVMKLAEAAGVIMPSWIGYQLFSIPSISDSRVNGRCGLAITFTATFEHAESKLSDIASGPSLDYEDKFEDEDDDEPRPGLRRVRAEVIRNLWSTPFTKLSPAMVKRKQRAKMMLPLQQTVLGMVSQFPSGRNSNRGGWQLPQRTLLEAADHGYPGVAWARDLIRTAVESHLLHQLATTRPQLYVDGFGRPNINTRKSGGVAVVKIGSSWANVNYASDHFNLPHVHISEELTSDLSGALYAQ
eukprot:COSAG02_NODE_5534_length_4250_cov_1.319682_2_plen_933_part_00